VLADNINGARKQDMSEMERATILKEIVKCNAGFKSLAYWNDSVFDIWIPDEVEDWKPIQ